MTEQRYAEEFGDWMKRQREELSLRQPEIAQQLGVSVTSVGNWERGICSISAYNERRVRRLFKWEREKRAAQSGTMTKVVL